MVLGNIYAPLSETITVSNIQARDLFFQEVIDNAPSGMVPIHKGDEFILHTPDAIVIVEVLEVKEYVYYADVDMNAIKTLVFTAATKSAVGHLQFGTIIEPFPIYRIYVSGEFMCILLSGDVRRLQTDDGMKQYHISEKYDTVSYLGELYYLYNSATVGYACHTEGCGTGHEPIYHMLILSKKRPVNINDYKIFLNKVESIKLGLY